VTNGILNPTLSTRGRRSCRDFSIRLDADGGGVEASSGRVNRPEP
jgi:hypothetical protein